MAEKKQIRTENEGSENFPTSNNDKPNGYQSYDPLWHLYRIRLFDIRNPKNSRESVNGKSEDNENDAKVFFEWQNASREGVVDYHPKVAIIDNGVRTDHPYLKHAIEHWLALDLVTQPYGLAYHIATIPKKTPPEPEKERLPSKVPHSLGLRDDDRATVQEVLDHARGHNLRGADRAAFHKAFPSHGTACAGLIAAFPPDIIDFPDHALAFYCGVDPLSKIIPINTSMNPDPEQLIVAFLYAYHCQVDVILIPRGISTEERKDYGEYDNPDNTISRPEKSPDQMRLWNALENLIREVSEDIPVICASGNSGENSLSYPASLSSPGNGVISVGAVSYNGFRSGYSNYGVVVKDDKNERTSTVDLVAPSDDIEVFNRHQVRLDTNSLRYKFHQFDAYTNYLPEERRPIYSYQSITSLDIPGAAGYAGGGLSGADEDDPAQDWFDPTRGAFALFGGTSAASAIVAGVAALVQRKAKNYSRALSGTELKAILKGSCDYGSSCDDRELKIDNINGETLGDNANKLLFGCGLVNVRKALEIVDDYLP